MTTESTFSHERLTIGKDVKMVSLRLPKALYDSLVEYALNKKQSMNLVINSAIAGHITDNRRYGE